MIKILKTIHRYSYYASVFFVFCFYYPLLWFYAKNPYKNYVKIGIIRRRICVIGSACAAVFFKVKYEEAIDWTKPFILCANHSSTLDISALAYISPTAMSFIGKAELLKNPVTRLFFKTIDIPVDRKSKISSFRSFQKANEMLKDGKSIAIFPEGKIDDSYPPTLHDFKSGAFRLAIDNNIPIIPVVIEDAWKLLWDDGVKLGSKPGVVHIQVLSPIATINFSENNAEELEQLVYNKMLAHWNLKNK